MRHVVTVVFWLGLPGLAFAAEAGPCMKLAGQQDRNACMSDAVGRSDAVLNQVYGQLNGRLDANGKRNLLAAERAWIVFRDRECELRSGYDTEHLQNNGTLAPFLVGECKLDLTTRRASDLREQFKCPAATCPARSDAIGACPSTSRMIPAHEGGRRPSTSRSVPLLRG